MQDQQRLKDITAVVQARMESKRQFQIALRHVLADRERFSAWVELITDDVMFQLGPNASKEEVAEVVRGLCKLQIARTQKKLEARNGDWDDEASTLEEDWPGDENSMKFPNGW